MTKNEYINFKRCPKAYILEKLYPEKKSDPGENVLNNYKSAASEFLNSFGKIAIIENYKDTFKMCEETKILLNKEKFIANATFLVNNELFMQIDILEIITKNKVNLHIVSSRTKKNYTHMLEASYYNALFSLLKIEVENIYLYTINSNYIRIGVLDFSKLFNKEKINNLLNESTVLLDIAEAKKYKNIKDISSIKINEYCNNPNYSKCANKCPFMEHCISELGKNNIFEISGTNASFKEKLNWYNKGIISYKDLSKSGEKYEKAKLQVNSEIFDLAPFINKPKLKEFLNTIYYPLYFIDFETYDITIPFADGTSPYEQVPSQYSLHIQYKKNGKLKHRECLAKEGTNTKREIAERLVKDIPMNVCVLAYNMTFEKTQIKKMAEEFPDLHDHLMNIHDNIKDLMIPFQNKYYYQKEFKGSYSIKYVLPALCPNDEDLDYKKLNGIHNGSEAMAAFATLHEKSNEEKKIIKKQLLEYCCLDTLAMVKILEKLYKLVK